MDKLNGVSIPIIDKKDEFYKFNTKAKLLAPSVSVIDN